MCKLIGKVAVDHEFCTYGTWKHAEACNYVVMKVSELSSQTTARSAEWGSCLIMGHRSVTSSSLSLVASTVLQANLCDTYNKYMETSEISSRNFLQGAIQKSTIKDILPQERICDTNTELSYFGVGHLAHHFSSEAHVALCGLLRFSKMTPNEYCLNVGGAICHLRQIAGQDNRQARRILEESQWG